MAYRHGVYPQEVPTSILPAARVDTAIPVVFGTAPIENQAAEDRKINEPVLCYSYTEFTDAFGSSDDWDKHTLCEFAYSQFCLFGVAPVVFINVFDPEVHKSADDSPDPTKVTSADILAALELVDDIFPKFRVIPGTLVAPGFSVDPAVAIAMYAKTTGINTLFSCMAAVDASPDTLTSYTDVPAYLNENNLINPNLLVCWPKIKLGDYVFHKSTQFAGLLGSVDSSAGDIPYRSPSNHNYYMDSAVAGGKEVTLGLEQANYLNGNGVVTALNFIGGWKCWGNRTSCYPSNTDPKDAFTPIRRFFNWHANTFITTYFQKIDWPINRRLIETILDSENIRLNGFQAIGAILGGRIVFNSDENPTTDLMDGIIKFHTYMTPPSPAREIVNILEYDPKYLETLFS